MWHVEMGLSHLMRIAGLDWGLADHPNSENIIHACVALDCKSACIYANLTKDTGLPPSGIVIGGA